MIKAKNFPKLESPFIRKDINGQYICTPEINEDYKWIFQPGEVTAVEKLDGTNTSIIIENNKVVSIYNRLNHIPFFKKGFGRFYEGIQNAIDKEYIKIEKLEDGQYFGELCGPMINGNPLKLTNHLWFPFNFLKERDKFKFWDGYIETLKDKEENEIFNSVKETFKGLWSLERRRKGVKEPAEGIVFYNKTGGMCKLRRDMFDGFKNKKHKENTNK